MQTTDYHFYSKIFGLIALTVVSAIVAIMFFNKTEKFDTKPSLTYYYLPGCGWCNKFTPVWEEFASQAPNGVVLRKVNAETDSEEVDKYGIDSFPHVQLLKDGKITVFNSTRTADSLMKFLKSNL